VSIAKAFADCYWTFRIDVLARRIARRIAPELRQAAYRKLGDKPAGSGELKEYVVGRAAQMAQPIVDELLRSNPQIPGLIANKLVISSAIKAAAIALKIDRRRVA
jgi:hypothetical protein